MKKCFVFAGESSGDLHGSYLVKELSRHFQLAGVAGPRMRKEEIQAVLSTESFEVMGFSDVFLALPALIRQFYFLSHHIIKEGYDAVVFIDYPGFSLRLAKSLRKKGYSGKIIQYISPSVWAHGRHRIAHMAATLDLLLTIYPFEKAHFTGTTLPVVFVGNPLQEYYREEKKDAGWRRAAGLPDQRDFIALFPGSRKGEIEKNLLVQLQVAERMKLFFPSLCFAVSCSHPCAPAILSRLLPSFSLEYNQDIFPVSKEHTHHIMRDCRSALAKSGTITLELALRECPTVVTYPLTRLNQWIAQYILKVSLPYYCIVNILANKEIFPEFFAISLPVDTVVQKLKSLYEDGAQREACLMACKELKAALGEKSSSREAAEAIRGLFHD